MCLQSIESVLNEILVPVSKMDFIRSFRNQTCPHGGLRSHCPNGKSCVLKHRDDKVGDGQVQDEQLYLDKINQLDCVERKTKQLDI